jgi:hypothetical protein
MKISAAGPIWLIVLSSGVVLTSCAYVNKAVQMVKSMQKKPANPNDACTFVTGLDISKLTGDKVLSKTQIPRDTSSAPTAGAPSQGERYDCSYSLASTSGSYQQSNMEVHMIPPDTYDSLADKGDYMQTSTETGTSSNGSVAGFSGVHDAGLWNQNTSTLYEKRNGYAISVMIPFTHSIYDPQDADKAIAKIIFSDLPSK